MTIRLSFNSTSCVNFLSTFRSTAFDLMEYIRKMTERKIKKTKIMSDYLGDLFIVVCVLPGFYLVQRRSIYYLTP